MTRQRRSSQLEMNFDGLTDSITNLVGTLILLVVLLVGLTSSPVESSPGAVAPPQPPQVASEPLTGPRTVGELLRQVETLRAQISLIEKEVSTIEQGMPELRRRASKVFEDTDEEVPRIAPQGRFAAMLKQDMRSAAVTTVKNHGPAGWVANNPQY